MRRFNILSFWTRGVVVSALAAFALMRPAAAAGNKQPVQTKSDSGVKIEVTNVYTQVPGRGYAPLIITINNGTSSNGVWQVKTNSGDGGYYGGGNQNYTTELTCAVPANAALTFELLAPLADTQGDAYRMLTVNVSGPGVDVPYVEFSNSGNGKAGVSGTEVFAGLSPAVNRDHANDATNFFENVKPTPYQFGTFDLDNLPLDWRGYIGFSQLIFNAADWLAASPASRAAILQWVAAGGDLRLIADQEGGLGLPARTKGYYGAGTITLFSESDVQGLQDFSGTVNKADHFLFNTELNVLPVMRAPSSGAVAAGAVAAKNPASVSYVSQIPPLSDEFTLVAVVIVIFGILVGPVNLFCFCRGSRRSRLLWVTPLLSLVASAILLAFIFISEGVGGEGIYYRVTAFQPEGKFAVVTEVESSKTGLLLNREFQLPSATWAEPVDLQAAQNNARRILSQADQRYWGDWLTSRNVQSLQIQAVLPSRASVRLVALPPGGPGPANAPALRSEYDGSLENLYYIDDKRNAWKAARLDHGQVVSLEPVPFAEAFAVWQDNVNSAPTELSEYMRKLTPQPGTFFALGHGEDTTLEPALSGLRWTRYRHVIVGPVEPQ